ncbi:MAG: hypothetical protein SFY80_11325 [Verrucomicrobiota bacterium]|nr:hypothetical protein [Verrucomicrobiota bacterium]
MNIENPAHTMIMLQMILQHWEDTDKEQGVLNAVVLNNNYTRTQFRADMAALSELFRQQVDVDEAVVKLTTERDETRSRIFVIALAFIELLRKLEPTIGPRKPPKNYYAQLDPSPMKLKTRELLVYWRELESMDPPVTPIPLTVLGCTRSDVNKEIQKMMDVNHELRGKSRTAAALRTTRTAMIEEGIIPFIREYRKSITKTFGVEHPIYKSLQEIFAAKGVKPIVVDLRGYWDAENKQAVLTWPPNRQPELSHYEVRACHGEKYVMGHDFHVGYVGKDRSAYETSEGMSNLGCIRTYRVLVVTDENRSRISNSVTIKVTPTKSTGKLQRKYKYKG